MSGPQRRVGIRAAGTTAVMAGLAARSTFGRQAGVTLLEMVIVVSILGLMVGITFPSVSAGIDSIRLASGADEVAGFLNTAMNRANRLQEVMEVEIAPQTNTVSIRSARPGFAHTVELPTGIEIRRVLPEIPEQPDAPRHFLLFPAGTVPRIAVELANSRGAVRTVTIDPITGVPQIQRGAAK